MKGDSRSANNNPILTGRRRNRRRSLWPLAVLIAGALACAPGAATVQPPSATATSAPPTDTAVAPPTPSPVPTDTPTPEPTATSTPDATALAQAQAAETQAAAVDIVQPDMDRYGLSTHQGALGWMHGPVTLALDEYLEHKIEVDYPDLSVADFVVQADITWRSTSGLAGCGFAVRAAPGLRTRVDYELLTIRLSGAPLWVFALFAGSNRGSGIASGDAPTLSVEMDSTNTVAVVGQGGHFAFFINGFLIGEATHEALREGTVAFLASQESGETTCTFENAWLWVLRSGSGVQAQ